MEALLGLVLILGVCAIVVRGFALLIARSSEQAKPTVATGRLSPVTAPSLPPFAKRNHFFSAAERSLYEILCRLTPEHTVFAKVRLADLVRVQVSGREFWQRFDSIKAKHVDFVVCDDTLAPVVAIELDDASQDEADRLARDQFVDSVLESAALPIVHVKARRGYVLDEIRQLLAPHLRLHAPTVVEGAESGYVPATGWRPSV